MVFIRKKLVEDNSQPGALDSVEAIQAASREGDNKSLDSGEIDTSSIVDEAEGNKVYNWNEILTILSDYINPEAIQQIEDDWMQNYPDGKMDSESVDDLLSDVAVSFNEEIADEIKARIDQLQSPEDTNSQDLNSYYSNFEQSFNNTTNMYNSGSLSKLEYLGQAGKLIHDFINGLQSFDEIQRGELFNKAEELVNNSL